MQLHSVTDDPASLDETCTLSVQLQSFPTDLATSFDQGWVDVDFFLVDAIPSTKGSFNIEWWSLDSRGMHELFTVKA